MILGAGPSGVIAAETIRKHAPHDEVIVIGDEPEAPYSRMAIPYLLIGKVGEEGTHLRHGEGHYERLGISLRRGRAKRVDVQARSVELDDGSTLAFDRLLIATGSSPASPPIPGIHGRGVHPCWTLKDARAIAALARPGAKVIQMGAGFIGCIIMEALQQRGVELTVVEMGDRMVPRMMGPTAGTMIRDWCEKKGVRVFTSTRVEAIERRAPDLMDRLAEAGGIADHVPVTPMTVRLSSGEHLPADLVISATGVRPNIGFLENSGITCLVGVLTDERLQTNVEGIYAAGDCAEAFDKVSGRTIVSAIQPNAAEQARVAAMNMIGRDATLKGVTQINVLDTLGMISASFGQWDGVPGGQHVELTDREEGRHLSLQFDGDILVGCNSIGWTEHVGVMRGLVEGQVRLGDWKDRLLEDPTLLMEAYLACAQAQGDFGAVRAKA
ncbi:FAD-dependent pyridine nucleotide-disulfide oxidoreductase [Sphaerotilus natans subsp. natans DSM 6575]|uniref:FAD-dependent pyridine nucleotide-disulfide oxidoreductase n=1 Tax=Sphaerotilus natans subsp. natans DSM 6575 TaxID=1286631 RepID=A0A059KP94_9BURK|nr:FAD-dependent pyridine nucleotide-disulfide oxidoreductase [Sphaerotilus natans subsp. natans DSM 6575]